MVLNCLWCLIEAAFLQTKLGTNQTKTHHFWWVHFKEAIMGSGWQGSCNNIGLN
jgi:hypothetical protein